MLNAFALLLRGTSQLSSTASGAFALPLGVSWYVRLAGASGSVKSPAMSSHAAIGTSAASSQRDNRISAPGGVRQPEIDDPAPHPAQSSLIACLSFAGRSVSSVSPGLDSNLR